MTGFGKRINTVALFLGIAAVSAGCSHTGTSQSMHTASSPVTGATPVIVPEKYGLVEQHLIEVDPGQQKRIYLKSVYTLASVDATEKSTNLRSVSRMTDYKGAYEADCPDVSPDGNSVVYHLMGEDGSINLWTMFAKTGVKAVRKTKGKNLNFFPTYASGGARIIFCSNRSDPSGSLWALGARGKLRRVTDSQEPDMWPHEDPIGQSTVAFTRYQPGDPRGEIWVYDRNSYLATQLREGRQPRMSPDGKKIAYSAFDPRKGGHWNIWVMNIDGSRPTQLTRNKADNVTPSWHPSGEWIIFASDKGAASATLRNLNAEIRLHNFDIWMTDLRGKQVTQLTVNGSDDRNPVCAPDGKTFFFSSNRGRAVDGSAQDLEASRGRGRTVTIGGAEYPVASGRDIWRAELSADLQAQTIGSSRSRQALGR